MLDVTSTETETERAQRCLLLRAGALLMLVDAGEMTAGEALDHLHGAWASLYCTCAKRSLRAFDRYDEEMRRRAFMDWRWRS